MKTNPRIELKLENFDKCHLICDHDCPLGTLYDYSCALHSFIVNKMKEHQEAQQAIKEPNADVTKE